VRATLTLLGTNLSQAMVGEFFTVSQSTVSRVSRHVLPLLEQVTCLHRSDLADVARGRVVLVDG
jgi:predicted XRE-type DNA-binding protein